jgi:hypothetical protein
MWFGVWAVIALVACVANIVLWLILPDDYLMTGIWNIVDVAPLMTVLVIPLVAVMLLVRCAESYTPLLRSVMAFILIAVLSVSLWGLFALPDWLMLPDHFAWHSLHPVANYTLAWGALCSFVTVLICMACAVAAKRADACFHTS